MNYTISSPLKAIQGTAIKDLTDGRFGPPKFGRSPSLRGRPASLSILSSISSPEPHSLRLSSISVPTKPEYIPSQRPPPKVDSSLPIGADKQNERSRKVVISRFLLVDGNVSFVVGTEIDGFVIRGADEVPVAKILDHVSPAELERFENQDFFDEDERERLLPPKKPRGRPRQGDRLLPSFNIAPICDETSREQSLLPKESFSIKKRSGRPRGSRNKKGRILTSTEPSVPFKVQIGPSKDSYKRGPYNTEAERFTLTKPTVLSNPSTTTKKRRGRPPRLNNLSVVIPSFNGPQPQEVESTPSAESESDGILLGPKPQYSMIAASGLGQPDTEDLTSRDQSVELVPSSKKRRIDTNNAVIDLSSDADGDEKPPKKAKLLPETSPDPIADDSAALLRQFQARVYGPDHPAKGSTIPHRQSKPSPTLDSGTTLPTQFHAPTRPTSLISSSSESLMGHTPRPLDPPPAQEVPSRSLPREVSLPQRPPPRDNPARPLASYSNGGQTVSHFPQRQSKKTTPIRPISPSKPIPRKFSLTPHFPPNMSLRDDPKKVSAERRPQPSTSSASRHQPPQDTKTAFSQSSEIMPSILKTKKPSPRPQTTPSQPSQPTPTSKIGFAGLPLAKDITDYFAPKASAAKKTPPKPIHSPTAQLLPAQDSGSEESEDQLARESSSTNSISSDFIVVQQNRATPTIATGSRTKEPSSNHERTESESSEDQNANEHNGTNTAAFVQSTTGTAKNQSSAETLNKAFEIEDDGETDSDSDSLSSEVMIIRAS